MIRWQKFQLWNASRRSGKPPEEYLTDDFLCWVRYEVLREIPWGFCPPEEHYRRSLEQVDACRLERSRDEKHADKIERLKALDRIETELRGRIAVMGYKI